MRWPLSGSLEGGFLFLAISRFKNQENGTKIIVLKSVVLLGLDFKG